MELLMPGESKTFKIKYLGRKIGKFIEQMFFKVKNGEKLSFIIYGVVNSLELLIEPEIIQFPSVAMCIPQMHSILLNNPHSFEIEAVLEIENAGTGEPLTFLEFCRNNIANKTSATVTSELYSSLSKRSSIRNFMESSGKIEHLRDSIGSVNNCINTIYNKVDEYLAKSEIITNIMRLIFDKCDREVEKRFIVDVIFDLVLDSIKNDCSNGLIRFNQKEWILSEMPKEISISRSSIKLSLKKGFESHEIKIFLTPNYLGKFTKNLKLKLLIANMNLCAKQHVDETIINVPIYYNCQPPKLIVHNPVSKIAGYAESDISLDILIENAADVDGFFIFNHFKDPEMEVISDEVKFHIKMRSKMSITLIVTPFKSGQIVKHVHLTVLGMNRIIPICIECKAFPLDIIIKPEKVFEGNVDVLVPHTSRIFIENKSATKARFFVKIEHDKGFFSVNPRGGILSSNQCIMIILEKKFYDPGEYRDSMIIETVNSKVIVSYLFILI